VFTFGSLFAGIGGIDLGLERAGMTCEWQVEIDDYCTRVLEKHWPHVARYRNVRDCGTHNLEPVDLIAGGFPCQPHSVAGRRRGKADDRNLWPEYRRIVAELRPRWVLAENVPGIIHTMLDEVLSDLESLAYSVGTLVVPAVAFDAPHRRDRVFIVANAIGGGCQQEGQCRSVAGVEGNGKDNTVSVAQSGAFQAMANASVQGLEGEVSERGNGRQPRLSAEYGQWPIEPDVGRVADGVPHRVDRLRALGNAVVPQVAEWIGRQILEVDEQTCAISDIVV
jgi:DNA (cytosine-5)-methyltransferase 1